MTYDVNKYKAANFLAKKVFKILPEVMKKGSGQDCASRQGMELAGLSEWPFTAPVKGN